MQGGSRQVPTAAGLQAAVVLIDHHPVEGRET